MLVADYGNASDDEQEDPESNVIISNGLPARRKFTKDAVVTFTLPIKKLKSAPPVEEPAPKRARPYNPGSLNEVLPQPKNPIPGPVFKATHTKINPVPLKSEMEQKEILGKLDTPPKNFVYPIKEESPPPIQSKPQQPKEIQGTHQVQGQPPLGPQQHQEVHPPGPQTYPPPQQPQSQGESPLYSPQTQLPQRYPPPQGAPYNQMGPSPPQGAPYNQMGPSPPQGAPYNQMGPPLPQGVPYNQMGPPPPQGAPYNQMGPPPPQGAPYNQMGPPPPQGAPYNQMGPFGAPVYSFGNYQTGAPSSPEAALEPPTPKKSVLLSGMPTPSKQWQRDLSSLEASDLEVIEINGADLHHNRWTQTRKEEAERLLSLSRGVKPTRLSKRKGQITHLAFEAEQQELLEKERKQAAKLLRAQTKAKYGW